MRSILVEPSVLENAASRIEQEVDTYQQAVTQLYSSVDTMKSGWEGKDNTAFTNQIYSFDEDFKQTMVLCRQFCEFLRNAARAYRQTQDDITSQANGLGR
ncbi:MAG: WXG100 family type VII secretion target [Erysipelotrichaceae bacterium]|nr:WXG100 family type VII secretion target [Erysipelotrichaceae bacterium]